MADLLVKGIEIRVETNIKGLTNLKKIAEDLDRVKQAGVPVDNQVKKIQASFKRLGGNVNTLKASLMRFRMEMLGVMFFGMLLQRTFQRIGKSAISTFQKIAKGSELANKVFGALGASLTFLKFTIGDALARALLPMVPAITDLVEKIVDWIDQHPKLTAWLVILGFVLGTALFLIGTMTLGLSSIVQAGLKFSGWLTAKAIPAMSGWITANTVLFGWLIAIAVVVLLAVIAFKKVPEAGEMAGEAFSLLTDDLKDIFAPMGDLIKKIFNITNSMGFWTEVAMVLVFAIQYVIAIIRIVITVIDALIGVLFLAIAAMWDFVLLLKGDLTKESSKTMKVFKGMGERFGKIKDIMGGVNSRAEIMAEIQERQAAKADALAESTDTVTDASAELTDELVLGTTPALFDLESQEQFTMDMQADLSTNTQALTDHYNALATAIRNANAAMANSSSSSSDSDTMTFQTGGFVPKTGMALVHAGEYVIPKNRVSSFSSNPTVNLRTGPVSSNVDVSRIAKTVSNVVMGDVKRHTKTITRYGS